MRITQAQRTMLARMGQIVRIGDAVAVIAHGDAESNWWIGKLVHSIDQHNTVWWQAEARGRTRRAVVAMLKEAAS